MRFLSFLFVGFTFFGWGQKSVYLHLNPKVNGVDLVLNTNYTALDNKVFKLDHFNYYLSNISLTHDAGQQTNLYGDIYLVEPENHTFLLGNFDITNIEQLDFTIGVPKPYNIQSGSAAQDISLYPETHPLSFQSPSMYWGWQSGYMHMIIGGFSDSQTDGTPDAYFELHNLGNNNQQLVNLVITQTTTSESQIDIYLDCNVEQWIKNIPLATVGVLHDESGINQTILRNVQNQPVFTLAETASLMENNLINFNAWVVNQDIYVNYKIINEVVICQLIDESGRIIQTQENNGGNGSFTLTNQKSGFYFLRLGDEKGNLIATKKLLVP